MEAIIQYSLNQPVSNIKQQMDLCRGVTGKTRRIVEDYLTKKEIHTLDEVDLIIGRDYLNYIDHMPGISSTQRKYYRNLLDQVMLAYYRPKYKNLLSQIEVVVKERALQNKLLLFFVQNGITDAVDIDYDIRAGYQHYLMVQGQKKWNEYVKAMDRVKLELIRKDNIEHPLKPKEWRYADQKFYLGYHPDFEIAQTFYYTQDKKELLYDFSKTASEKMKRQIFGMLNLVLREKKDRHDRRERFLLPLQYLLKYCIEQEIEDIEQLTADQIRGFQGYLESQRQSNIDTGMQIIHSITKYLFLTAEQINWSANMWYLERFTLLEERKNPAREIERITFGEIRIKENREDFQMYMKYLLGIAQRLSLQTVRGKYYNVRYLLLYCDTRGWKISELDAKKVETYIRHVDDIGLNAEAYNRRLLGVQEFYRYLVIKKKITKMEFHMEYYLQTVRPGHHNRLVPEKDQRQVLSHLKELPLHLRLMFLHLWSLGIRVSEVCSIKAGMYIWDGENAWLRIYQCKLKKEKNIPIPQKLYELMKKYIETNHIAADEYVFSGRKGGAYDADTFTKQMQLALKKAGISDCRFRPHDYRHTVATMLDRKYGVSISVIRDYLGHNNSDMTRQYLDHIQAQIDQANKEYFDSHHLLRN